MSGLPPLTRGAPGRDCRDLARQRSTPAHAGSTTSSPCVDRTTLVYPRSRGEHRSALAIERARVGLPPLTRGAQCIPDIVGGIIRSTPAHAGSTLASAIVANTPPVYPRSRGEHSTQGPNPLVHPGLPPLTRGALELLGLGGNLDRSTPAHAGSTSIIVSLALVMEVYPRSRGEHSGNGVHPVAAAGLPPLTRGALYRFKGYTSRVRSTPAHAGSTPFSVRISTPASVYPRSRGEHPMC